VVSRQSTFAALRAGRVPTPAGRAATVNRNEDGDDGAPEWSDDCKPEADAPSATWLEGQVNMRALEVNARSARQAAPGNARHPAKIHRSPFARSGLVPVEGQFMAKKSLRRLQKHRVTD
jgi:hypothetical protein